MITLPKDKVAVTPIWDPDVSESGLIVIPDIAKERCDQGIVKYIGPDVKDVKLGDYVVFSGYDGTLVHIQDEGKLIILNEKYIKAVLSEPPNIYIPGLYFKLNDGTYEIASYESAIEFITAAFTRSGHVVEVKGGPETAEGIKDAESKRT